jgi:aspartate/methionine/tyrosine aminotransferase
MIKLADCVSRLGAEGFGVTLRNVAKLQAQGVDVIPMHAGQPDFDTPENIVEAGISALRAGKTRYAPTLGIDSLKKAIAQEMYRSRSVQVEPDNVIVMPGAKPMIFHALVATCESGDEVICTDPAYPIYASVVNFVGAKVRFLPLAVDKDPLLDITLLRELITTNTRMIILNSPLNPGGNILNETTLGAIAELANEFDLLVLSDEIYSRIIYDHKFQSIASLPGMLDRTILVDGFSKTYAMTGWRLGYGIVPNGLVDPIRKLILSSLSSTNTFIQAAGVEALQGPQDSVDNMVAIFRQRREVLVQGLNALKGFQCQKPDGAFYAYADISGLGMPSEALRDYILEEAHVATYSGTTFGSNGEGYLRFSFACSEDDIRTGLKRIAYALEKI